MNDVNIKEAKNGYIIFQGGSRIGEAGEEYVANSVHQLCEVVKSLAMSGEDVDRVDDGIVQKSEWETLVYTLRSIAYSSCCASCREAGTIAKAALYKVGELK